MGKLNSSGNGQFNSTTPTGMTNIGKRIKKLLTLSRDDHEDSVSRMKATKEALEEKQKIL
ncbi:hypothetical protein Taro_022381 [Colocasia esculenta]|uniref:Uncharacterized protein n=1 Tax=Colocasia esculenta TaxID=4460 RepID=A0A843V3P1_COLES|nr:hypothetical protein [Colocasia esculenta]